MPRLRHSSRYMGIKQPMLGDGGASAEAPRIAERFEGHRTPKRGGWLNMSEPKLRVLSSQCLDRRVPDKDSLIQG
jgi:hypothetical protein